jgi:WD40 repeat protein
MTITSRPSKQQKMAEDSNDELRYDLPNCLISDQILPFVDRPTWDNLIVANREIYQGSRNYKAPWPVGELIRRVDDEEDEQTLQLCFSSDGRYLCVLSDERIRMWHNVEGSCGRIADEVNNRFDGCLWRVCFSPVENLLVSLHKDDGESHAFRLWEVNTGGMVFKVEVRLDVEVDGCAFSRDGRQLILRCDYNTLRIYSVSDAQLIKVIQMVGDSHEKFLFVGITADGCQFVCIQYVPNHRVCLWDVHRDGSPFEEVYVCQKGEVVSEFAISPLDDSIAIMTRTGVIKLAHRRARGDITWTVEVVADGKCFDTAGKMSYSISGQLLAKVRVDGGVEIWDAIKGKCLRTIVCDRFSKLAFSPDGSLLAATTSWDSRLCLYNI